MAARKLMAAAARKQRNGMLWRHMAAAKAVSAWQRGGEKRNINGNNENGGGIEHGGVAGGAWRHGGEINRRRKI